MLKARKQEIVKTRKEETEKKVIFDSRTLLNKPMVRAELPAAVTNPIHTPEVNTSNS
jgi:hypothetical protein